MTLKDAKVYVKRQGFRLTYDSWLNEYRVHVSTCKTKNGISDCEFSGAADFGCYKTADREDACNTASAMFKFSA